MALQRLKVEHDNLLDSDTDEGLLYSDDVVKGFLKEWVHFSLFKIFLQQLFVCKDDLIHQIFTHQKNFLTSIRHNFPCQNFMPYST